MLHLLSKYGTIIALVGMIVAFSIKFPSLFPTQSNGIDILSEVALTGIIAVGLTIPLIAGEFDLSIGWLASFAGVLVTGFIVNQHMSVPVAFAAVLLICAGIGLINGLIVTKAGVHSFIATLGTGTIIIGLNFAYSSGVAVAAGLPNSFLNISYSSFHTVPTPVFVLAGVAVLVWLFLNRTVVGHQIQAVGGNAEAAKLAGISVDQCRIIALMFSSTCAGLAGILLASKLGSGQVTAGDGYLLDAFAAAFLGSVALRDGEFHILGTIIGVLTVGVGFNGLALGGAATYYESVFKGSLLILAVALSTVARRIAAK